MNKSLSRWLLIGLLVIAAQASAPDCAHAQWGAGGYHRWYGWAGPLYGGFGGYPGARYVSGVAGGYGPGDGVWGCDCWSGMGVGSATTPSPTKEMMQPASPVVPGNSVIMNLNVPPKARVYINGQATNSIGSERHYRLDNLQPGDYPYQIRVELDRDGQKLVESRTVQLRTGRATAAAFDFDKAVQQPAGLVTSLTLRVPEGAKVFLGDNLTHATGAVRRFATTLKPGDKLRDYRVRVEARVDGKLQTQQQVISLAAGEAQELKFDFETARDPLVAVSGQR